MRRPSRRRYQDRDRPQLAEQLTPLSAPFRAHAGRPEPDEYDHFPDGSGPADVPAQPAAPTPAASVRGLPPVPAVPSAPPVPAAPRWPGPIIVDQPVAEFLPQAPDGLPYVPDTVVDGWSTVDFHVRLASVRGYAHRYRGRPRQDHAVVRLHEPSGSLVLAVADGVSSAPQSHRGAMTACDAAVYEIRRQLDHGSIVDWDTVVAAAVERLLGKAARVRHADGPRHEPMTVDEAEQELGTTLVSGVVQVSEPGRITVSLAQVGDSEAWVLDRGHFEPVLRQKTRAGAAIVSSAVSPLPRTPRELSRARFELPPNAALLIGTDGFGDPLGDGTGLVGDLFRTVLAAVPPPLGLAHTLDFSRETFDDDRTLVAVFPRRRR